jgi:hypothetical protein
VTPLSLTMSESLGLFELSNPCATRGTSFVDDSESLGSLYSVESKRPPWQQFR